MAFLNSARQDEHVQTPELLHVLAQQKVRLALAALGKEVATEDVSPQVEQHVVVAEVPADAALPTSTDVNDVLAQALDRMHEQLGDVCALDREGRELSWSELAEIVIGPLGARSRDADTAAALLVAVAPDESSTDTIYADLVAEHQQRPGGVMSQHETFGNGAHRYVFRTDQQRLDAEV